MRTGLKETASASFAPNLLRDTPSNKALLALFDSIANPELIQFRPLINGLESDLMVTSGVAVVNQDSSRTRGLGNIFSTTSYDGRRLIIDTSSVVVNDARQTWGKSIDHPDVIFWAETQTETDLITYGRGKFAGISGLWSLWHDGRRYAEMGASYCNEKTQQAYQFFKEELKLAAQSVRDIRLVELETVPSVEPPTDWYSEN